MSFIAVLFFDGWSCFSTPKVEQIEPIEEVRLLIGKKGRKSPSGEYALLPEESMLRQWTRIFYSLLVIFSFMLVLQLLQLHRDMGFLVKMIEVVFVELIPFFILFVSLIIIFAFALFALNTPVEESDATNDYYNMDWVGSQYFLHVVRTALGDF